MTEFIQIHWTCQDIKEAREISALLIKKKLVACAQIIPEIESIYFWKENIESQKEVKVTFKTVKKHFESVKKTILEKAKYQIPEILETPIIDGHHSYLNWISESTV